MAVNRVQRADGTVELDVTGVTAAAADVTAGKKFVNSAGVLTDGTMPSVTQATPSITVSSAGLITASATQSAGKVAAGTKSATKQLTTKAATTYTPKTTNQTISAGQYLTGAQTIAGDANLVAANIVKGKSIFGVAGSAATAGTESIVTGTVYNSSYKVKTISGLTFKKIKAFYIGVQNQLTTNSSTTVTGYLFFDGDAYVRVSAYNNNASTALITGGGHTYTYSNGTLTVNLYDQYMSESYLVYAVIGEV